MQKVTKKIEYEYFTRDFHKRYSRRLPINGSIELTARCNLNCLHCYMPHNSFRGKELSLEELTNIIDQIADAGCMWLLFTGGEPLLRKDFSKIYIYAKKKGLLVSVFTNGTLIDKRIANLFSKYPPFCVEISLYGISCQTYEAVTRIEGSFASCIKGIEMLKGAGIAMRLKTVVLNKNKHELGRIEAYASKLNIPFHFDPIINPGLDGSLEPCKMRLTPAEVAAVDMGSAKRIKLFRDKFFEAKDCKTILNNGHLYKCAGGMGSFSITSDGRLNLCEMAAEPAYDLRAGSFKEGYYRDFPRVRAKKFTRPSKCPECKISLFCPQCPALAYLETKDSEKIVGYYCEIARLRYKCFIENFQNKQGLRCMPV